MQPVRGKSQLLWKTPQQRPRQAGWSAFAFSADFIASVNMYFNTSLFKALASDRVAGFRQADTRRNGQHIAAQAGKLFIRHFDECKVSLL